MCDKELISDKKYILDYLEALYNNCWIVSEKYLIGENQPIKDYLITVSTPTKFGPKNVLLNGELHIILKEFGNWRVFVIYHNCKKYLFF